MMRVAFSAPSHGRAPRNTLNNLCFVQAKCHGLYFLGLAPKLLSCGGQADVLHSMPSEAVSLCNFLYLISQMLRTLVDGPPLISVVYS